MENIILLFLFLIGLCVVFGIMGLIGWLFGLDGQKPARLFRGKL